MVRSKRSVLNLINVCYVIKSNELFIDNGGAGIVVCQFVSNVFELASV